MFFKNIHIRIKIIMLVTLFLFLVIMGKVFYIQVIDYKKSINDLVFDSSIYTKETYDEEKLNRLEKAKDKVKYTLELTLTKNSDDEWKLNALTNEDIKKIQGMY